MIWNESKTRNGEWGVGSGDGERESGPESTAVIRITTEKWRMTTLTVP